MGLDADCRTAWFNPPWNVLPGNHKAKKPEWLPQNWLPQLSVFVGGYVNAGLWVMSVQGRVLTTGSHATGHSSPRLFDRRVRV